MRVALPVGQPEVDGVARGAVGVVGVEGLGLSGAGAAGLEVVVPCVGSDVVGAAEPNKDRTCPKIELCVSMHRVSQHTCRMHA